MNYEREGGPSEPRLVRLDVEGRARALGRVPLFAGCDEYQLREIAECAHMLGFETGQVIVPEGEKALGFYLLLSGAAHIARGDDRVARLGAGDFFGEVGLIEGSVRTASVVAEEHTVCLGILRTDFRRLLVRQPRIALRILDVEAQRLEE